MKSSIICTLRHVLGYYGDEIKGNVISGTYSTHGGNDIVGRPERERSLRKPRHRWKDNIQMHLKGRGY
jgi:hypothetical protein